MVVLSLRVYDDIPQGTPFAAVGNYRLVKESILIMDRNGLFPGFFIMGFFGFFGFFSLRKPYLYP